MRIIKRSPVTGQLNARDIDVTIEQLIAWQGGVLIQDAMPHLSADDREFILTGMTPEDWEEVFGDDEYGDEEPASAEPECEACGLPLDNVRQMQAGHPRPVNVWDILARGTKDEDHDRFCDADCAEIAQEVRA